MHYKLLFALFAATLVMSWLSMQPLFLVISALGLGYSARSLEVNSDGC